MPCGTTAPAATIEPRADHRAVEHDRAHPDQASRPRPCSRAARRCGRRSPRRRSSPGNSGSTCMVAPSWMLLPYPDVDRLGLGAQRRRVPDAGPRREPDLADHARVGRDPGLRRAARGTSADGHDQWLGHGRHRRQRPAAGRSGCQSELSGVVELVVDEHDLAAGGGRAAKRRSRRGSPTRSAPTPRRRVPPRCGRRARAAGCGCAAGDVAVGVLVVLADVEHDRGRRRRSRRPGRRRRRPGRSRAGRRRPVETPSPTAAPASSSTPMRDQFAPGVGDLFAGSPRSASAGLPNGRASPR